MICRTDTNSTATNGHGLGKREALALSAYYFLFFAALSLYLAFLPVWFKDRGLGLSEIALLLFLFSVSGALMQVRLGHLSDSIGSRKWIAFILLLSLGISYLFYDKAHTFLGIIPLCLWSGSSFLAGFTLPQAIISDWTSAAGSAARGFSVTRIWGTIGFILPLVAVTKWPSIADGAKFLYLMALFYAASAVPIAFVREAPIRKTTSGVMKGAMRVLKSQRAYVYLLCYALFKMCEAGSINFLGLYVKSMGGGEQSIAMTYWICAVAEIPIVMLVGRISDRVGRKLPLLVAFIIWPIRLFLFSLADAPTEIYYLQLLHGFTFGITLICSVAYMSDIAPEDLRGTAQGLLMTSSAFATSIGPLLGGFIGDPFGLPVAFRVMAGIMAITLIIFVIFVKEPRQGLEK